jgi:predicted HAD superfamily Cof-like phosphohydrolase
MRSDFNNVGDFHEKFGLPNATHQPAMPHEISEELRDFRLRFLLEELTEICEGYGLQLDWTLNVISDRPQDLSKIADGLIDLSYVTLGLAHLHHFPWEKLFQEVQRANLSKERAAADGSNSTRGSAFDVIKPPDWRGPDIASILAGGSKQIKEEPHDLELP